MFDEAKTNRDPMIEFFGEPISVYTRAQALEDGVLIDVSETAREAGVKFPVAMTAAAWADCVAWTEADSKRKGWPQDESGRLWDVLYMMRQAIRSANGSLIMFQLYRVPVEGKGRKARLVTLKAICGPADDGSPCITVMQPNED